MTLKHHCITLAHRFRLGHYVESGLTLPDLLEQVLLALPQEHHNEAARIIAALLACQERNDWLGLADWLEGELAALLST